MIVSRQPTIDPSLLLWQYVARSSISSRKNDRATLMRQNYEIFVFSLLYPGAILIINRYETNDKPKIKNYS